MRSFRFFAVLCAAASLTGTAQTAAQPSNVALVSEETVSEKWRQLHPAEAKKGMTPQRLFLPFPASWPPDGSKQIRFYAYGRALRAGLKDGEINGSFGGVWTQAGEDVKSTQFEALPGPVEELGIQGVRPLRADEAAVFAMEKRIVSRLIELMSLKGLPSAPSAADEALRKYYRLWRDRNGILAKDIEPRHRAFFAWIQLWEDAGIVGKDVRIVHAGPVPNIAGTWVTKDGAYIATEQAGNHFTLHARGKLTIGTFQDKEEHPANAFVGTVDSNSSRIAWSDGTVWKLAVAPSSVPQIAGWWVVDGIPQSLQQNGVNLGLIRGIGSQTGYFIAPNQLYGSWSGQVGTLNAGCDEIAWSDGTVWNRKSK